MHIKFKFPSCTEPCDNEIDITHVLINLGHDLLASYTVIEKCGGNLNNYKAFRNEDYISRTIVPKFTKNTLFQNIGDQIFTLLFGSQERKSI